MIVSCRISVPGGWLYLNEGYYRLAADSFADTAETWRRTEVTNPFLEGSWLVNALRENVTETLSVWVKGNELLTTAQAVEELRGALRQLNFVLQVTFDQVTYTYTCYTADNSVKASRELRHASMAQVIAQIPRHPGYSTTPAIDAPETDILIDGGAPDSWMGSTVIDGGGV